MLFDESFDYEASEAARIHAEETAWHDEMIDEPDLDESEFEDDGQPTEYEEWQDLYGGDDWDQGQYDYNEYGDY